MSSRFRGATYGVLSCGVLSCGVLSCGVLSCEVLLVGRYWWGATGGALTYGVLLVGNGTRIRFGVAPLLDTSSSRMPLHA